MSWRVHLLACQRLLYRLSRRMRCQAAAMITLYRKAARYRPRSLLELQKRRKAESAMLTTGDTQAGGLLDEWVHRQ